MYNLWLSGGLCFLRLAGDFCLVASAPLLIYRLRKDGTTGVSVETQILRLIMFLTRYLDLFVYGGIVSTYNTCMKIILAVTSLHAVTALIFEYKAYSLSNLKHGKYRLGLPLLFAACLAPLFTYRYTFIELAWAFSQFLGAVAYIPQLALFVNPEIRDWKMNTYVCLVAGYRAMYIPHWILRYLDWGVIDPIAVIAGVSEATIFAVTYIVILRGNYKRRHAKPSSPEDGLKDSTVLLAPPAADAHIPNTASDSKSAEGILV